MSRVILELRVRKFLRMEIFRRRRGQWLYPSEAVAPKVVWILYNCGAEKGEERLDHWEVELEVIPVAGRDQAVHRFQATRNMSR